MSEHTGASYEEIAVRYAAVVDSKPWNAFYERPAVLSLLPPLRNLAVLDAGCGSGWYAEHFVRAGAAVTAFDLNAQFVALSRARIGEHGTVLHANLAEPLLFAADEAFDVAVCSLVLHYLRDWVPALQELHRVLKPQGTLVFSTHHPFMDWQLFKTDNYFATELLHDEWEDIGKVSYYRRPLTAMTDALDAAGFSVERLLEPQPTEEFRHVHPKGYERLTKNPWFLVIRARRE